MVKRGKRSRNSATGRLDPNIYILEDASVAVIDTAVNSTLVTNDKPSRLLIRMKGATLQVNNGTTNARVFWVLRRLPSGYTAPAITVGSGTASFVDQPDVLGYGFKSYQTTDASSIPARWVWLKPSIVLYEGDQLLLQAVTNTTSPNLIESGVIEWGSKYL